MMQIYNIVWYFVTPTLQNPSCSAQNDFTACLEVNAFGGLADAPTREVVPSAIVAVGGLQGRLADAVDYGLDDFEGIETTCVGGVGAATPVEDFIAVAGVGLVKLSLAAHNNILSRLTHLLHAPAGRRLIGGEDEGALLPYF